MNRCPVTSDQEEQGDEGQSVAASMQDTNLASPKQPSASLKVNGPQGVSAELSVHGRLSTRLLAMSVPLFFLGMLAYLLTPFD